MLGPEVAGTDILLILQSVTCWKPKMQCTTCAMKNCEENFYLFTWLLLLTECRF
jgi:hypothetical protein